MPSAEAFAAAVADLRRFAHGDGWWEVLCDRATTALRESRHGDLAAWQDALARLPSVATLADCDRAAPRLGAAVADPDALRAALEPLHPWRKGPLELGGLHIDTEWRSDLKWDRVAPHVDLAGSRVLDVGCGNGYFGWRMLGSGARFVVGIDPTLIYVMQWLAGRHFAGDAPNFVLPLGIEDLPAGAPRLRGDDTPGFDTVFSMGVLYHRRDPLAHLHRLRGLVRPRGTVVVETLVLPADRAGDVLVPEGRYARMRNVHAVPGTDVVMDWLGEAGLVDVRLVDVTATTPEEQRSTDWMRFESLAESLAADGAGTGAGRTVEGHPAPIRAVLVARR